MRHGVRAAPARRPERDDRGARASASAAPRELSRQTLAEVIEPRVEELFSLVQQVLRESGFEELKIRGLNAAAGRFGWTAAAGFAKFQ